MDLKEIKEKDPLEIKDKQEQSDENISRISELFNVSNDRFVN